MTIQEQMQRIMDETGWPMRYRGDAEIDRLFTLQNPHLTRFVWAVTPNGTHLAYQSQEHTVFLTPDNPVVISRFNDPDNTADNWVRAIHNNFAPNVRYYIFNNGIAPEVDLQTAWDFARTLKPVKTTWTPPAVSPYSIP